MLNDENIKEKNQYEDSKEEVKEDLKEKKLQDETLQEAEANEDKEFEGLNKENQILSNLQKSIEEFKSENRELKDNNKKFQNELEEIKDRLLRINAEYDNFRKRTEKEKKAIYTDACEDVLKHILPVFDNLERAIEAEGDCDDLKEGIDITMKQFEDAFGKLGIEEINTDGEFDPNYHNAIMHIEDEKLGKNQIVEVFQKGFKRGEKVLRYSLVKVAN